MAISQKLESNGEKTHFNLQLGNTKQKITKGHKKKKIYLNFFRMQYRDNE